MNSQHTHLLRSQRQYAHSPKGEKLASGLGHMTSPGPGCCCAKELGVLGHARACTGERGSAWRSASLQCSPHTQNGRKGPDREHLCHILPTPITTVHSGSASETKISTEINIPVVHKTDRSSGGRQCRLFKGWEWG